MSILRSLFVLLFLATPVFADIHNCADCGRATVAAMIADEGVTTGDTVTIPAGSCTWSNSVTLNKSITLQGAGIESTIITLDASADPGITSTSDSAVIRDICFKADGSTNDHIISITGDEWRVTGCAFESTSESDAIIGVYPVGISAKPGPTGLIDACTFTSARVVVIGSLELMSEGNTQHELWASALDLGGSSAVYIENCTFATSIAGVNSIDSNYAGAYVPRYNNFTSVGTGYIIEAHSVQTPKNRAVRKWEIYNNLFTGSSKLGPMFIRGGTGVIFNNKLAGTFTKEAIVFDVKRAVSDAGAPCGYCNGNSVWDGNTVDEAGYPCRDQIGRGPDDPQWSVDTTDGDPYGAYTQPLTPAYVWGNLQTDGSTELAVSIASGCESYIQASRDYYSSQHPTYTRYQCPHPLTGLSGTCSSSIAGRDGYNLSSGITGIGSGGSATTGGSGTITLTSP